MQRPQWILPVLVGGLLGATVMFVISPSSETHAGPAASRGPDGEWRAQLDVLGREIADLKRMVRDGALAAPTPSAREEIVTVPEVEGPDEDLLERLESLEAALVRATSSPTGAMERLDRFHPVQLDQIQRTAAQIDEDYEAVQRSLQLMSLTEAIERFGFPDQVSGAQGNAYDMYWAYKTTDRGGDIYAALELYFVNGRVMHVEARWRD